MRKTMIVIAVLVATGAITGTKAPAAGGIDYGPGAFEPSEKVVTPHIAWAKPLAGGPVSALFLTYRVDMRGIVEVAQRLEMDYDTFVLARAGHFHYDAAGNVIGGATKAECHERLEAKLRKPYDVIVLGNIRWDDLPIRFQYEILKKVKDGAGLAGVARSSGEYLNKALARTAERPNLAAGCPWRKLPAFAKYKSDKEFLGKTLRSARLGKGRILMLTGYKVPQSQCLAPRYECNPLDVNLLDYDYYQALIIRTILYAARRDGDLSISAPAGEIRADRKRFSCVRFDVESGSERRADARFVLRSRDNRVVAAETRKGVRLARGKTQLRFPVKAAPAGEYFADMWLLRDGKVLAFGSLAVTLTSADRIAALALERKFFKTAEPVSGKVAIRSASGVPAGARLIVEQRNNYGRLVAKKQIALGTGKKELAVPFAFPVIRRPLTIIQHVGAKLLVGADTVDATAVKTSYSDLYPREEIRYVLWQKPYSKSYLAFHLLREIKKAGFDTHYTGFSESIPLSNLYHIPYATRLVDVKSDWYGPVTRKKDDHVREPVLTDPKYRDRLARQLAKCAEKLRPYSTLEYSMGDECHFTAGNYELCFAPTSKAFFRAFLKKEYGTLKALNEEYGAAYKSFDEVEPITLAEAKNKPGLIPLWVDFRRAMESEWADIYVFCRDQLRKHNPRARVGYEGSDTSIRSTNAADFWKLSRPMQFLNCYDKPFLSRMRRDFAPPGTLFGGGWYGGYDDNRSEEFQRWISWHHLLRGSNLFMVWHGHARVGGTTFDPDFSVSEYFRANLEEMREIKRGIGKLISTSKRSDAGVAVVYSASSVHKSTLTDSYPRIKNVLRALGPLLVDCQLDYRAVSYAELTRGILEKGNFKLVVLPFCQALSPGECEAVREFVKSGGVALADLRPAVCDEHGKPYPEGRLDDVFGVTQQTSDVKSSQGRVTVRWPDGTVDSLRGRTFDPSLKTDGGKAVAKAADAPAVVVHDFGLGKTMLLNFSLADYKSDAADAKKTAAFFSRVLAWARRRPAVRVSPCEPGLKKYVFSDGANRYVGILEDLPEPFMQYVMKRAKPIKGRKIALQLDSPRHVYDMRAGKYLGRSESLKLLLTPGRARMLALLPYRVEKLTLSVPSVVQGGREVPFVVELRTTAPPARHVVRLDVFGPDGAELEYYGRNLDCHNGRRADALSLALDEKPGRYTIRARDVASGVRCAAEFVLRGGAK